MLGTNKLLLIGLDGYDADYANLLMARGELPSLAQIKSESARFQLDHGSAKRSGLAFEHFSSGLSPDAADRWSAVYFDKTNYQAWQEQVRFKPFTQYLNARTLVFDTPYFDLASDPTVQGVVSWGAHDPGTALAGQPPALLDELLAKFGHYPAPEWIYGFAWPSVEKCRAMGERLSEAVAKREEIIDWLFRERNPDWDVGIAVVSELHSASEGLWHGVDSTHPLHDEASAPAAAAGMEAVYRAVDRLIGNLKTTFPDATLVLFSLHGMGANESDVASMALLPEMLLRKYIGRTMLAPKPEWLASENGIPRLGEQDSWRIPLDNQSRMRRIQQSLIESAKPIARKLLNQNSISLPKFARSSRLGWMPAIHYQPYWRKMPVFALPSFYDGRIRVNLVGREQAGIVSLQDYQSTCEEVIEFLRSCINVQTGRSAVRYIELTRKKNPLDLEASEADIIVEWDGAALSLQHPEHGSAGPIPYRRPGGHTGGLGISYISGQTITPGDFGTRSAFDVVPTIFHLADEHFPAHLSGTSLLQG